VKSAVFPVRHYGIHSTLEEVFIVMDIANEKHPSKYGNYLELRPVKNNRTAFTFDICTHMLRVLT
jgi:hypothetical protein